MLKLKDYYQLLRVDRNATGGEIKKAYRGLAMIYHPDRNQNNPECQERLKEINVAYGVLGDVGKRRQYDMICNSCYGNPAYHESDVNDEPAAVLRGIFQSGFFRRGGCGCSGGFERRGCRRKPWDR